MFTQAQIEYIQKQFTRGLNTDAIRNKLVDAGWDIDDIEDGFKEVERLSPKNAIVTDDAVPVPVKKSSPMITFLIIFLILIILASGGFVYYKFIYLSGVPSVVENVDTQKIETATTSDKASNTEEVAIPELPVVAPPPMPTENIPVVTSTQIVATTSVPTPPIPPTPSTTTINVISKPIPNPPLVPTTTVIKK